MYISFHRSFYQLIKQMQVNVEPNLYPESFYLNFINKQTNRSFTIGNNYIYIILCVKFVSFKTNIII